MCNSEGAILAHTEGQCRKRQCGPTSYVEAYKLNRPNNANVIFLAIKYQEVIIR